MANFESRSTKEQSIVCTFPLKIAKIGIKNVNRNESGEGVILFNSHPFRLLTRKDIVMKILLVRQFGFCIFDEWNENNEKEVTLWLVLHNNFPVWNVNQNSSAIKRLINEFFIVPKKNLFDENEDNNEIEVENDEDSKDVCKSFDSIVENLYKSLQAAHTADDNLSRYADDYIQHEYLQVKLKPYQIKTIKWMLDRERILQHHTNGFVEVKKRFSEPLDGSTKFFYNPNTLTLTTDTNASKRVALPTGGILAEQMGMGKTIEILDLILLNPRPLDGGQLVSPPENKEASTRQIYINDMKCLCAQRKTKDTVMCTKCLKLQHRKCVDQNDSVITPDVSYICPGCWQNEDRILSKTTLIVSPQSIKSQWKTETDNRIQSGKISILLYVGSKSCKWVNPKTLASYDIILTDYETFRSEFDYSVRNSSDRVLRNSSNTIKRRSPLLNMNFWRICLDESQMVIDMKTRHAQLISDLSAVHRWAVTGTPIETSLNDLFGLISYINYAPYNQSYHDWTKIVDNVTESSNFKPLLSILQPIMRRTCKSESIMTEMGVPEQVQQVHYVELNRLSRYKYNQERDKSRREFNHLISSFRLDTPLTSLSPHLLERVMEPVRTLRRNCSILHVVDEHGKAIVMRPAQMYQYLVNANETEARSALQKIASKLKSFVKLSLGDHEKKSIVSSQTMSFCENMLNWANKYANEPSMIESMLQTQIIHNFLLVKNNESTTRYDTELKSMKSVFYNTQFDTIINFKMERQKEVAKFSDYESYFERNCFQWASAALNSKQSHGLLFSRIRSQTCASFENVGTVIGDISNISEALSYWSHNLLKQRAVLKQSFYELAVDCDVEFEKEGRSSDFFLKILNEAKKCHLIEPEGDDGPTPPKKKKSCYCTLCSFNDQLSAYSVFISDTAHKMIRKNGLGGQSTNPSFQEYILKAILQSNEFLGNIDTKVGINLLTALENFRDEFQKYKNLLTSITKAVYIFALVQKRKSPKPTITYSTTTIKEWCEDIAKSKIIYDRNVRVNRYLNCMKESSEIDECAICMSAIDENIVFECGHQCCNNCFMRLLNNNKFECPFCRQIQPQHTTHHFKIDKGENFTDSSNKIELIVRQVHALKKSDPNVKILIFSQWIDILNTLKIELLVNEIPSRSVVNSGRSLQKMVEEFKDPRSNINCLLMPYRCGSKGLNLIEATHVFLIEPIINRGEELQTLGRIHRIGQTRKTCVHRFITKNTIEETIFRVMSTDAAGLMSSEKCTVKTLVDLFSDTASEAE